MQLGRRLAPIACLLCTLPALSLSSCDGEGATPVATAEPTLTIAETPLATLTIADTPLATGTPGSFDGGTEPDGGEARVDPVILDLLQRQTRVPVIVSLRQQQAPAPEDGTALIDQVLASMLPSDFSLTYRWDEQYSFAGSITAGGLAALRTNSSVVAVVLDEAQPLAPGGD